MGKSSQSAEDNGFSMLQKVPTDIQISQTCTVKKASSQEILSRLLASIMLRRPLRAVENTVHGVPKWQYARTPNITIWRTVCCEPFRVKSWWGPCCISRLAMTSNPFREQAFERRPDPEKTSNINGATCPLWSSPSEQIAWSWWPVLCIEWQSVIGECWGKYLSSQLPAGIFSPALSCLVSPGGVRQNSEGAVCALSGFRLRTRSKCKSEVLGLLDGGSWIHRISDDLLFSNHLDASSATFLGLSMWRSRHVIPKLDCKAAEILQGDS